MKRVIALRNLTAERVLTFEAHNADIKDGLVVLMNSEREATHIISLPPGYYIEVEE